MKINTQGRILLLMLLITAISGAWAQKLALENTYKITREAKKGYLDEVTYDAKTQYTTLSFVTRASSSGKKSKVNYQNYFFDKDFNFVKVEDETDVNYRNKKYRGDDYQVEGVTMENNLVGTFVLKKKLITYTWNWFFGGYNKKVKKLDKVKPKDDLGNKYTLRTKYENDETGEVLAFVNAKGKTANPNEFLLMLIDKDLNIKVTDASTFESPQSLVASYYIPMAEEEESDDSDEEESEEDDEDDAGNLASNDISIIFAASSLGKKADADMHNYTYWRVNAAGSIIEKVSFKAAASAWNVNQAVYSKGDVYLGGPANEGKYYDVGVGGNSKDKWKFFQLAKISNKKAAYVTLTDIDEFDAKLKTPPSQKRSPSYDGKRFQFAFADALQDGSIIVSGQNYEWVTVNKQRRKSFRDVVMFHFDNMGKLKSQYGVRREENNKDAKYNRSIQFGVRGKSSYYWTILELDGFHVEKEGDSKINKPLLYPSVARIDAESGNIGDFVQFGTVNNKPTYYLHRRFRYVPIPEQNAIVYLGVDKPGKVLWFGKVIMD